LCSGKLFYDLQEARENFKRDDVAIIRIEQLYPLTREQLDAALSPYRDDTPVFWVQEEPENMGAWRHMFMSFGDPLLGRFPFKLISRPASATPATGSHASHEKEQSAILKQAFNQK
jgi:2-oxoglutarate dehydrogenase E1 component